MAAAEHAGISIPAILIRRRFAICLTLAMLGALVMNHSPSDAQTFSSAGAHLLDGQWRDIYQTGWLQAGPLQLLMTRLLMLGSSGPSPATVVVIAVNVVLVLMAMSACRSKTPLAPYRTAQRQLLCGAFTAVWVSVGGLWSGHTVELVIPLLWLLGLRVIGAGKPICGVLALGLSAAIAPWAVLALPGLIGVARPTRALVLAAAAAAVSVCAYLPWVVAGTFRMFAHVWPVAAGSGPKLLDEGLVNFDWRLRLAQGAIVGLGTATVAIAARHKPETAVLAAPLATALLRVVTDPVTFDYYWISVGVFALIALARAPSCAGVLGVDARVAALPYLIIVAVNAPYRAITGAVVSLLALWILIDNVRTSHVEQLVSTGLGSTSARSCR